MFDSWLRLSGSNTSYSYYAAPDGSKSPMDWLPRGYLGLRLKLESGEEPVTTATERWNKLPDPPSRMSQLAAEWLERAKESLSRFESLRTCQMTLRGQIEPRKKTPAGSTLIDQPTHI